MKKTSLIITLFVIVFISVNWTVYRNYDVNAPCDAPLVGGHTGAPGETSCTGCHGGTDNTGPATLTFNIGGGITQYVPGQVYSCTVGISQTGVDKMGFSCLALRDFNNSTIGTFTLTDPLRTRTYVDGTRDYVSHTPCGADASTIGTNQWTFDWQAPATNVGNITLYLGSLASNHNHATTGDSPYTRSVTLTPSTAFGVNELSSEITHAAILPNPASDQFTISFNNLSDNKIEINLYDVQGKRIKILAAENFSKGLVKEEFSVKDLGIESGIYFIKISVANKQLIQKLIIN